MEALPTETAKKASSENVEPLPSEEDSNKANNYTNVDAVSTEEAKKAGSENLEAMPT